MAAKKTSKKTAKKTAKKAAVKKSASKKSAAKKTTAKKSTVKTAKKKTAANKTATKKTAKKAAVKKSDAKKKAAKKTAKKAATKKAAKKTAVTKSVAKKKAAKKTSARGKTATKSVTKKKVAVKKAAKKAAVKKTAKKTTQKKAVARKTARKTVGKTATKTADTKATEAARSEASPDTAAARPTSAEPAVPASRRSLPAPEREARRRAAILDATDEALAALRLEEAERASYLDEHERLEATKYETELREKREEPQGPPPVPRELDEAYGETMLRVLVRDPEWVYAYWEIAADDRARYGVENKCLAVRYYDVTDLAEFTGDNAHYVMDVEVNHFATSWYQHLPQAGRHWCAELGVFEHDGRFTPMCRAPIVDTPPKAVAALRPTTEWMYVAPSGFPQIFEVPLGMSVAQALEAAVRRGVDVPDEVMRAAGSEVTAEFSARLIVSGLADRVLRSLASGPGASMSFLEMFPWLLTEEGFEWLLSSGHLVASDSRYHSEGLTRKPEKHDG